MNYLNEVNGIIRIPGKSLEMIRKKWQCYESLDNDKKCMQKLSEFGIFTLMFHTYQIDFEEMNDNLRIVVIPKRAKF